MNIILGILLFIAGIAIEIMFKNKLEEYEPEYDNWFLLYLLALLSTFCFFLSGIIILI